MPAQDGAAPFLPQRLTLPALRRAIQECRGCDLYKHATRAVLGEGDVEPGGKPGAKPLAQSGTKGEIGSGIERRSTIPVVMMIGEQPGDREDLAGHPFVGPAGQLLDRCLEEVHIERRQVYVTNAVKHFKWEPRGKRRLHKKPSLKEVRACRPWLDAELEAVKPDLIVCLGAVAAQSLLGSGFKVTETHGVAQQIDGLPPVIATMHPSSILRARTDEDRHRQMEIFLKDLQVVAEAARSQSEP